MATSTYLSNPTVLIGAVDCSDQCSSATLTVGYDSLESTAFGDAGHRFVQGLQSVEVTLTMFASYGASEMEATLYAATLYRERGTSGDSYASYDGFGNMPQPVTLARIMQLLGCNRSQIG